MSGHVVSARSYFAVFLALMVFTALTVWAAYTELGPLNNVVMLGIAFIKATLVILFFMHVWYSEQLTWLVVTASFAVVAVMLLLTMSDILSRGLLGTPGS